MNNIQDVGERADAKERKRLLMEKEEERKRLVLEAELEEKQREQERRQEMNMQAMMFNYLQQLQYTSHNPTIYGPFNIQLMNFILLMTTPYFPQNSPDDTN